MSWFVSKLVDEELGAWDVLEMPIVLLDLTVLVMLMQNADVLALFSSLLDF